MKALPFLQPTETLFNICDAGINAIHPRTS